MITLKGKQIYLRALEPEDLEFVYTLENDETLWELSSSQVPLSKYVLKQYLENALRDIFEVKQLRLVISNYNDVALGLIDIFDFDFKNRRAGVGIVLTEANRDKGHGKEALNLLMDYSFNHLDLHQLYCDIFEDNEASIKLFELVGFKKVGLKKDWSYSEGIYRNVFLFQCIKN